MKLIVIGTGSFDSRIAAQICCLASPTVRQ